jgi:ketosteroid isomerase-like protein
MHHLVERIDVDTEQGPQSAWVLATNVYVKTAQGWRLAAHHASPGLAPDVSVSAGPPDAGGERPSTLH